jgi:hypothetical protein
LLQSVLGASRSMFCTVKESAAFNLASSVSKSSVFCQIETPRRRARRGLRGEGKVIGYLWWVIGRWKNRPLPPWRWFPTTMPQSSRSFLTRKSIAQPYPTILVWQFLHGGLKALYGWKSQRNILLCRICTESDARVVSRANAARALIKLFGRNQ